MPFVFIFIILPFAPFFDLFDFFTFLVPFFQITDVSYEFICNYIYLNFYSTFVVNIYYMYTSFQRLEPFLNTNICSQIHEHLFSQT